jgi:hypothetical protein
MAETDRFRADASDVGSMMPELAAGFGTFGPGRGIDVWSPLMNAPPIRYVAAEGGISLAFLTLGREAGRSVVFVPSGVNRIEFETTEPRTRAWHERFPQREHGGEPRAEHPREDRDGKPDRSWSLGRAERPRWRCFGRVAGAEARARRGARQPRPNPRSG